MMRVFRDEIARHLIDEAERLHPDKIKFHFEKGIKHVDLDKGSVIVSGISGDREVCYIVIDVAQCHISKSS